MNNYKLKTKVVFKKKMSGLLFLTSSDFAVTKGTKGPILCHGIKGFSLILFYATQCDYCKLLIPQFKRLPGSINGCQFGLLNVVQNKDIIRLANNTIAPIEYVPSIFLYINGRPYLRYDGPHDENEIKKFVLDVATKFQNKQQFSENKIHEDSQGGIPSYCLGTPIKGDKKELYGKTYLKWVEAYKQIPQKQTHQK